MTLFPVIESLLAFGATYVGKRTGPGKFADPAWVFVALSFGMCGAGLMIAGGKTARPSLVLCGIGLAAMPYLISSFLWLAVIAVAWVFLAVIVSRLTGY